MAESGPPVHLEVKAERERDRFSAKTLDDVAMLINEMGVCCLCNAIQDEETLMQLRSDFFDSFETLLQRVKEAAVDQHAVFFSSL